MTVAKWLIIPATGTGLRFGDSTPKQYLSVHGKTILEHTLALFLDRSEISKIVVSLSSQDNWFNALSIANHPRIHTVIGGKTRQGSVWNALSWLKDYAKENDWVLIHDAVRPCLHEDDLLVLCEKLKDDSIGGILATKVTDTLKKAEDNTILHTLERENIYRALTPQMFRFNKILEAHILCQQKGIALTDDASAIEAAGFRSKLVVANHPNPKLTYESDLVEISFLLEAMREVSV